MAPKTKLIKAKYQKGENTLNALRKATLDEIINNGYHRTNVLDIVKSAKLTRGAFYNYWTSLDNCLIDLILAIQVSIQNNPYTIAFLKKNTDPSKTIKKIKLSLHLVFESEFRYILLPTILLREKGLPDNGLKKHLEDYMDSQYQDWLDAIIDDQKNCYILPSLAPQTVASGIMNLMAGFFHNSELKLRQFDKPMDDALKLFVIATLTEEYRENHNLKSLIDPK